MSILSATHVFSKLDIEHRRDNAAAMQETQSEWLQREAKDAIWRRHEIYVPSDAACAIEDVSPGVGLPDQVEVTFHWFQLDADT